MPEAALLIRPPATVVESNAAARVLLERHPGLPERICAVAEGREPTDGMLVSRVGVPANGHLLARLAVAPGDLEVRVAAAVTRWGLTDRQREVLALVATGLRNHEIARRLGCAEATVERHVAQLLERAGCESRAQVTSRLWSWG